jgi:hypothetical protein
MSTIKNFKMEDGRDPEIEWEDRRTLCFMDTDDVLEMRGMELTDGGTFTFPGGAETITRLGDKYLWLSDPSRSVVVGGRATTKDEEARWLDEEEALNEARRVRLARWREELRSRAPRRGRL